MSAADGESSSAESIDDERASVLVLWDELCSAHADPWAAAREEYSRCVFGEHTPPAGEEDDLVTMLEGRGTGQSGPSSPPSEAVL